MLSNTLLRYLDQAADLVTSLDDTGYLQPEPMAMHASIGGHLRHVLEHIEPILNTPAGGLLDYDARPRDKAVETSRVCALERTRQLQEALRAVPDEWENDLLRIRNRVAVEEDAVRVAPSSRARELIYAIAHTVHHFALIRVMCNLRGIALPENFGYAPSTLHHLKTPATR
ncbi:MAG: hypothetical protein JJU05_02980 [Verrucomicrobia bacterium]|nr:hypothetical protein [Verrucomicrobiota bacterium]MCH8527717.1 hypothetical protein [Kiritimatiellia bacterium]